MSERQLGATAGIVMLAFIILAVGAFSALTAVFDYPDILRQPTDVVLGRFAEGGAQLVLIWFVFTLSALSFVLVAMLFSGWAKGRFGTSLPVTTAFGVTSAVLQAVGLVRWVFVVPPLAARYADAATGEGEKTAIATVFGVIHQYGGVAIGESLGQITLAAWTLGAAVALVRLPGVWKIVGIVPLATVPLWLLAQTELLHTAVPGIAVIDTAPTAFILWEAWLLALALVLIFGGGRRARAAAKA